MFYTNPNIVYEYFLKVFSQVYVILHFLLKLFWFKQENSVKYLDDQRPFKIV